MDQYWAARKWEEQQLAQPYGQGSEATKLTMLNNVYNAVIADNVPLTRACLRVLAKRPWLHTPMLADDQNVNAAYTEVESRVDAAVAEIAYAYQTRGDLRSAVNKAANMVTTLADPQADYQRGRDDYWQEHDLERYDQEYAGVFGQTREQAAIFTEIDNMSEDSNENTIEDQDLMADD